LNLIETGIPGLVVVEPLVHKDERGFFMESWNASRYRDLGLPGNFVQFNVSRSGEGVIRGLHYQYPKPQEKLVQVLEGSIFDVAVDIRPDSPTFRQWAGVELSAGNFRQLFVPRGFAHGFCVLKAPVLLSYMVNTEFVPENDRAIAWNDPDIGIEWPLEPGHLSVKDRNAPRLEDIQFEDLPHMES
jgi:dTDP-4-dehydrorhamnose 3,5-epimerase